MSFRKVFVFTLALLVAIAMAAPYIHAQSTLQGDVTGTVTDPSGAVVPGATATLKSNDTGATQTRTTNSTGAYRFALLPPGRYTLTVVAPSYQAVTRSVVVTVGQAATVNVQLALEAAQQTVTVTAEGGVIQTESPNIATTMTSEQVHLVPNGGGDLSYIAQTAPGAAMNTQAGFGNFSTFGLPGISNNFTYNGMAENDPFLNLNNSGATNILLGQNDIREATVVNNGYSGQYSMGGANVNYVSNSGTNKFHGNAIYWWNGRIMNANNYFNKQSSPPAPRGFVNDNQWAASFGGPIKKDKTFFFADFEGLRVIIPVTRQVNIPSTAFATATLNNIASVQPAALPLYQSMFNLWANAPGAAAATNKLANGGCRDFAGTLGFGAANPCALQFNSTVKNLTHEWLLTGRVDHNIGNNDRLFVHIRTDQGLQATYTDPINPVFNIDSNQPQWEGQLGWNHTIGTNTVNSLSINGSYYRAIFKQPRLSDALALQPTQVNFAGRAFYDLGRNYSFPSGFPQGRNVTQYGFVDDLSHSMGRHNLKVGANLSRYDITDYDPGIGSLPAVTSETLTDFFSGTASTFTQSFPARSTQPVALYRLGFYGSDEWRVRDNLKLTLTMRFDRNSNPNCRTDCFNRLVAPFFSINHDINTPYNQSILSNQSLALPSDQYHAWQFQPRFGFNWSPFGANGNTVISGGFGIFGDVFPAGFVDNLMNNLPGDPAFTLSGLPFAPAVPGNALSTAAAAAAALRSGFASGATLASLTAAVPGFAPPNFVNVGNNISVPRFQEWNLQIQRALGQKTAFTIKYVGNHGIHQQIYNNGVNAFCDPVNCISSLAAATGFAGTTFAGLPTAPTDPRFLQMTELTTGYRSNYNGVTATLQRRFSAFQFQINYTYSHALDFLSNNGNPNEPYNFNTNLSITNPQNPFNPFQNMYGNADYDTRHYLSVNYVYNSPRHFGPAGILGDWVISGTIFARTGLPFTILDSGTGGVLNAFGYGAVNTNFGTFADQTGGFGQSLSCGASSADPSKHGPCPVFANFVSNVSGFGNQRRNQVYGPRFFNTDFTLMRNFHIPHWEAGTLSVGANFFNIFNHPNFDQPVGDVANPSNGTVISTVNPPTSIYGSFLGGDASPRNIQLTGRITF